MGVTSRICGHRWKEAQSTGRAQGPLRIRNAPSICRQPAGPGQVSQHACVPALTPSQWQQGVKLGWGEARGKVCECHEGWEQSRRVSLSRQAKLRKGKTKFNKDQNLPSEFPSVRFQLVTFLEGQQLHATESHP